MAGGGSGLFGDEEDDWMADAGDDKQSKHTKKKVGNNEMLWGFSIHTRPCSSLQKPVGGVALFGGSDGLLDESLKDSWPSPGTNKSSGLAGNGLFDSLAEDEGGDSGGLFETTNSKTPQPASQVTAGGSGGLFSDEDELFGTDSSAVTAANKTTPPTETL